MINKNENKKNSDIADGVLWAMENPYEALNFSISHTKKVLYQTENENIRQILSLELWKLKMHRKAILDKNKNNNLRRAV